MLLGLYSALLFFASPSRAAGPPSVRLDKGVLIGASSDGINAFLGVPFARPPVGDLRFRLPQAHPPYRGTLNATAFGSACLQQTSTIDVPSNINPLAAQFLQQRANAGPPPADSEDCLTVNVFSPANATNHSKLPVLFWIFGGGFEGGTSADYPGNVVVEQSIALSEPVVFVSVNYRCVTTSLGFPGGKEVREAGIGNLGLHDQRLALRWVQKYIAAFGGDPTKVTIWGQSSGAISVSLQMLTNSGKTEGLFRAAFMQSGSPVPTGPLENGQNYFDRFATVAGCGHALGSKAVFDCLRKVPTETIRNATDATPSTSSYESLSLAWLPREDGVFLEANPQTLIQQGSVARIPFVSGDVDDEATLFSLTNSNITTEEELVNYLSQYYVKGGKTTSTVQTILSLYPADPADGSPFDTGAENAITPQYKRIAALLGDIVFQAPRRFFQASIGQAGEQKQWAYLSKRFKGTQLIGSYHQSDVSISFGGDLGAYLIHFAHTLNPSGAPNTTVAWPQYDVHAKNGAPAMLTLLDGPTAVVLGNDTYRKQQMEELVKASMQFPL
ncbi:Alpha/Beta hydrolase protein [Vararia minispora EC-137]|uniref:Alpha/Beta hydrolase protein n=1 Tax=Vararia minispora EC-137 TaxID=1314806 RepID=A0ACB8QX58_9AGAM|nr:Alpha/Beta hydrolase protein [Vararia minispora EC-137]